MIKRTIALLLGLVALTADAQVTIPYTFTPGQSIPAGQFNADFSAVANEINSHEVASNPHLTTLEQILSLNNSCGAQAINFNESQAIAMRVENLGADPTPGHKGRVFVNTVDNLLKYDDGTNIISIAGTGVNTLSSVLNSGNSAGAFNLDMNGNQILSARLENRTSAPAATAGRIYYRTDLTTAYVCSGSSCTAIGGAQSLSSVLGVGNSAGSTNIDFNSNQAKNMVLDTLGSDPGSPTAGQIWYNSASHIPKFYNGTSSLAVGNTNTLAQTLVLGNSAGATAIDFNGNQAQHMVVWNNAGSPGTGTGGYLWYDTGTSSLNYETSGANHRVCSLDGTETITNHTIDGGSNTLTNIADGSLSANVQLLNAVQTISGKKTFSAAPVISNIKTPAGGASGHQVPDGIADDVFTLNSATQTLNNKTLAAPAITGNSNFNEGQAVAFRVENRSSNPTAGNAGRMFFKTTTGELLYDDGSTIHALTASGLSILTGNQLTITGTSDVTELSVQGNGTQTSNIVEFLKSDASVLFALSNAGNVSIAGNLTTNSLGSGSTNPATAGAVRLASTDTIDWRNNANGANVALGKDTSDQLSWAGTSFLSSAGVLLAAGEPAHTGDVTNSAGSLATTVAKIAGTTVSGTTGTTNVVFSASPTVTGTVAGASSTWSGTNQSAIFQTGTATPATAGVIRLANGDAIDWRNNANGANIALAKDTSDNLTYGGIALFNSSGVQQASSFPALTSDVTTSAGSLATTIAANAVTNAKFRQGVARSVVGVTGNATANVADIQGTANQVLTVNSGGTALAFGQVNLASTSAVTGNLGAGNGGTGIATSGAAGRVLTGDSAGAWLALDPAENNLIKNCALDATITTSTLVVSLRNASGSNPIANSPCQIAFRSATATDNLFQTAVPFTSSISVTAGATAGLGHTSLVGANVYVYMIQDTTSELCLSNSPYLDDSNLHSATATPANTGGTLYCTNTHTSRPTRLLGRVKATWSNPNWSAITNVALVPFRKFDEDIMHFGGSQQGAHTYATGETMRVDTIDSGGDPFNAFNTSSWTYTVQIPSICTVHSNANFGSLDGVTDASLTANVCGISRQCYASRLASGGAASAEVSDCSKSNICTVGSTITTTATGDASYVLDTNGNRTQMHIDCVPTAQ